MDMDNVSKMLKEARLAKGLSLEEAEAATSIRKLYLDAVEEGEFDKIPGDVLPKALSARTVIFWGLTGRTSSTFIKHKTAALPRKR